MLKGQPNWTPYRYRLGNDTAVVMAYTNMIVKLLNHKGEKLQGVKDQDESLRSSFSSIVKLRNRYTESQIYGYTNYNFMSEPLTKTW